MTKPSTRRRNIASAQSRVSWGVRVGALAVGFLVSGLTVACGGDDGPERAPRAKEAEKRAQRLSPAAEFRSVVLAVQPGEKVRDVEIDEPEEGGYSVSASFDAGEANILGDSLGQSLIENDMKETYRVLYTSKNAEQLNSASLTAYAPVVDQYGNESPAVVYATTLDGATGRKINWDNFPTLDFGQLWQVTQMHPQYEQE